MITHGLKPYLSYNVTLGSSSAQSSAAITSGVRVVRLVATVACWVKVGPAATTTADTTTSVYLPAAWPEYFQCSGNHNEIVAGIEAGSAGTLNITEMTN